MFYEDSIVIFVDFKDKRVVGYSTDYDPLIYEIMKIFIGDSSNGLN